MVERNTWITGSARALALVAEPIPRAGVLAAWCNSWLAGESAGDDVIDAVAAFGTQIIVDTDGDSSPLIVGLSELRRRGVSGLRLVLPVPGDAAGLPGPMPFNTAAVAAGQAVMDDEAGLGLVPDIDDASTTWTIHSTTPQFRQAPPLRPEEAAAAIREALQRATAELTHLDVGHDPVELSDRLRALETDLKSLSLPLSMTPQAIHTAHTAARVLGILAIAHDDDGATVTTGQAAQRAEVMADLAATARHALAAACSTR